MHAAFASVLPVTLAEIGDKTQLLTLFLAARFAQRYAIILGMLVATLLNHLLSAWIGVSIAHWLNTNTINIIVGISFILVGLWLLKPDRDTTMNNRYLTHSAFVTTLILFFLAEIGDKTQIATILLAAHYQSAWGVVAGSTFGLLLANVPVIFFGHWLTTRLPFNRIRLLACLLFCVMGIISLYQGVF
ncbi:TMEM165/GDT1 family protein [Neisseriaceae bacterium ESL0693]|nr:TMEM165/GDT1 family protein [Neisseriaceae bacterium ESL0693]